MTAYSCLTLTPLHPEAFLNADQHEASLIAWPALTSNARSNFSSVAFNSLEYRITAGFSCRLLSMEQVPKLTCERCKRRKIRCDKGNPCSSCKDSNTTCHFVQRARLPRGRTAKPKKNILEERISRLESLLNHVYTLTAIKLLGPNWQVI